jgi:Type IV pilus assembly protein PilM
MAFFNSSAMAFTIEGLSLRMLTFSGKKIENWYSIPLNPNFVKDGLVVSPDVVGRVVAEAIQEKGVPRSGALAAVPSTGAASQVLSLPRLKGGKLGEMVVREVKRLMPGAADVDYVYWQPIDDGIKKSGKQSVYALAVPKNSVISIVETCDTAGIKLKGLELRPFALARAVNCNNGIIVHGEVDGSEIVIVDKSVPVLFRNIPVKDASPSVEAAWQNLIRELPFTIDYYNRSHHDSAITAETSIYMSGGLTLDPQASARLAQATGGRKVERIEPPPWCPENFPIEEYLVNVGLMLKGKW